MAADGQVVFEIQGDNKALKDTLTQTTSAIEKESKNWDNAVDQSSQKMQNAFAKALDVNRVKDWALKAGKAIFDFGVECLGAASDLQEVQNVVDTTFGESASEIDAWAKNAINQFGLTETQAKRFASTMGAMMKSSGIASKDITEMSENLAGLAADMTSFYNLDFDEAFNKIRSGISGETEPLKQLGINMSVANLEAFALSQGLKKTFNEMSQGEQVMLRYQYLMQATSDAQGDFSRTSDGFANGLRLLQSNFETLKTTVGSLLLPVISDAISGLNSMLSLLIPATKQTTVLDEFANIDLKTEQKISAIQETKQEALNLLDVINQISSAKVTDNSGTITSMSNAGNILNNTAGANWSSFINGLNGVDDVITNSSGGTKAGTDLGNLAEGAEELTGTTLSTFKYDNLPDKLKDLYGETGKAGTAKTDIDTIDTEAGKLTKNQQTTFKYEQLVKDLNSLETNVDQVAENTPADFKTIDESVNTVTGNETRKIKFKGLETDLTGLQDTAKNVAEETDKEFKNLDKSVDTVTGTDTRKIKFKALETDLTGLQDTANTVATNTDTDFKKIDSSVDTVTGTESRDFKYDELVNDLSGLESTASEVAEKTPGEYDSINNATDKVTGTATKDFKYNQLTQDIGNLESNADSAATDLPSDLQTVNNAASTLSGEDAGFKYSGVNTGVERLVTAGNDAVSNDTVSELGAVQGAAANLSGTEENFKYSDLTDSTDGVGALITAASGGTDAGGQLTTLGEGAEKVAAVNYTANGSVKNLANDIKILKSTDKTNWTKILEVFNNIPGYTDKIDSKKIESIASAFAGLGGDKAEAWATLMDALGSDLTALSTLTGTDENGAAAWLESMKNAANGLGNDDVDAWDRLLTRLAEGTPGAGEFLTFGDIYKIAEAMGVADSMYVEMDGRTVSLTEANGMYLDSLKRLVSIYPELSDMINTETGEIIGGNEALEERITKIAEQAEKEAILYGIQQKRAALEKKFAELPSLRVDVAVAKNKYEETKKIIDELNESLMEYGAYINEFGEFVYGEDREGADNIINAIDDDTLDAINNVSELKETYEDLNAEYERQTNDYRKASAEYDRLAESVEGVTDAQKEGAGTARNYNDEQKKAAKEGVEALTDALKEMNDYVERTRKSTSDSVDNALKGFKQFETGAEYIRRLQKESEAEYIEWKEKEAKAAEDAAKANKNYTSGMFVGKTEIPTIENMKQALTEQKDFLDEYNNNIQTLKEWGLSDEFLAQFSDMSQENAGYLYVMAQAGKQAALDLDAEFKKMSESKDPLVNSLTELKLKADDEFNELVEKAKQAAIDLNNEDVAKESMAATVEGIAKGIQEAVPDVKAAVDALNAELARLGEVQSLNVFDGLNGGGFSFTFTGAGPASNAKGLDYVPYNNYLSYLHEGEAILTAEEAAIWRNFKNGGANINNNIDYGQLSGAIWDKAPNMGGGNVYLDGATVGRIISSQQANAVRALERSGWQG